MSSKYSHVSDTYGGKTPNLGMFNMSVSKVPSYNSMGYESLTHGNTGNGSGHYTVRNAYSTNCTKYVDRSCSKSATNEGYETQYVIKYYKNFNKQKKAGKINPDHFVTLNERIMTACNGKSETDQIFIKHLEHIIEVDNDHANAFIHMMLNLFAHLHDMKDNNKGEHNRIKNILEDDNHPDHEKEFEKILKDAHAHSKRENYDSALCAWMRGNSVGRETTDILISAIGCTALVVAAMAVGIECAAAGTSACVSIAEAALDYMWAHC